MTRRHSLLAAASLLALAVALSHGPAQAQEELASDQPVLLQAVEVVYDRTENVVMARGDVEIAQEQRVLRARQVRYDVGADIVVAEGDVAILEPTGEVVFAERVELTGDLKTGTAREILLLLPENARIGAARGRRIDGTTSILDKAVYSPCLPCEDDSERPLLWQIKAAEVVHSTETKDIEYKDARLEFLGLPILYTPYFVHPDPTVERRSGLLAPSVGGGRLGFVYQQPYYWAISPHQDVTLAPMITSDEGVVMVGEHRRLFRVGEMKTEASLTRDSRDDVRGHIHATGRFDLTERWRAGYDVERSSDDTYLRRYRLRPSEPWLTTRPFVEGFSDRSYALAEAYAFQGLRDDDDPGMTPLVFPAMVYSYVGDPGFLGGRWNFDANALALFRGEGTDTRRISLNPSWQLPITSGWGDFYLFSLGLRADAYQVTDLRRQGDQEVAGRAVPTAALEWRYPLIREDGGTTHVIEPILLAAVSPYGGNPDDIPNEDSLDVEFDVSNVFRVDRFTGVDRIEGGPRLSYGINWSMYRGQGLLSAMVGQVFRPDENSTFPASSGLRDNFSDVVGRIEVAPSPLVDIVYMFRLDAESMAARRNEVLTSLGPQWLRFNADYVFLDQSSLPGGFDDREEIALNLSYEVTENWSASLFTRYDLADRGGPLVRGLSATYDDECFTMIGTFTSNQTQDRDFESGESLIFRFVFKTLGDVPFAAF